MAQTITATATAARIAPSFQLWCGTSQSPRRLSSSIWDMHRLTRSCMILSGGSRCLCLPRLTYQRHMCVVYIALIGCWRATFLGANNLSWGIVGVYLRLNKWGYNTQSPCQAQTLMMLQIIMWTGRCADRKGKRWLGNFYMLVPSTLSYLFELAAFTVWLKYCCRVLCNRLYRHRIALSVSSSLTTAARAAVIMALNFGNV